MWPATAALLITNAIVWLLEMWVVQFHPHFEIDKYFALSVEGLRHGYIWQLLSYQFMHAVPAPWHLLVNSWIIFVFGRVVEITLGKKRMLWLYFLSGTVGGLVQMAGMAFVPRLFGAGAAVGASAGAFGLVAAFAMLYPLERLYVLLFFVIPLRMRATTFLWVAVGITLYGIFEPLFAKSLPSALNLDNLFGNVAHAAHLGGIVTGCLLARQWARRRVRTRIVEPETKTSLKITPAPE
ncbi:MAG TPA: rhomboid family intramembrane serine protease [Verrucomicrobiae bacterium]|nr:rhomboid family intramembrane serine protease [Verrucomicrobiae bacterium]